jgi:addiction module RelE/StbE family toxin
MEIYYSSKFAAEYKKLPLKVKKIAEKKERIFRQNPFDSRLETHKLKGSLKGFFSFSINQKYRIILEIVDHDTIWFHSVGDHSIYKLWES